ncbi:MAG: hypothetical protein AAFX87_02670 [Bacteroidota bacterium]
MSCEENELSIDGIDPFLRVRFFDNDSITLVADSVAIFDLRLEELDSLLGIISAEIDTARDSLNTADSLFYQNLLEQLEAQQTSLEEEESERDSVRTIFTDIQSRLNSGEILLDSLTGDGAALTETFDEVQTEYIFRLNPNADISTFFISIRGNIDTLSLGYERVTQVIERNILVQAQNLDTLDHSFLKLEINCQDTATCISDETTIRAYY